MPLYAGVSVICFCTDMRIFLTPFPELEGPVSLVSVSRDNLLVMACSSAGILGFLDVKGCSYNTLMRSHTDTVLGFSVDGIRRHLATASSDGTVRVWSMDSLQQVRKQHLHNCIISNLSPEFFLLEEFFTIGLHSLVSCEQLYDFVSVDSPGCVAFHPSDPIFSCGFNSGIVRVFDISGAKPVAEHRCVSKIKAPAYSLQLFIDSWHMSQCV